MRKEQRMRKWMMIAGCALALLTPMTRAQTTQPVTAELTIRADQPGPTINKNIYGHFAEHLGRCIYDGLYVGKDSKIPNTNGVRTDIIEALKKMQIPVLRWPGGCFADEYHWRDGIGPVAQRPHRVNTSWGGTIEVNTFGTHEFMDLCELIGADAYVGGNVGSGTVQEMMDWIEYMTSDANATLANERRKNGREKPWKLPYFAVGNETWGCGGNMTAEEYANQFRKYSTFVKSHSGNTIARVAVGPSEDNYEWSETLLSKAGREMQAFSLHYYTLPSGQWRGRKGAATGFPESQYMATMVRTLRMDELIRKHSEIMDKYDRPKRIGLFVDEWGTWYDPEPGTPVSVLYQQNTIRDAVVAGINLNIFHAHADRVKMANIAQTVNVLQAIILTQGEKMILTPTYHVFEMYKVHQGATFIPIELKSPSYQLDNQSVPAVNASASRDSTGKLHLSLVNLDPHRTVQISTKMAGAALKTVTGRILTAGEMDSRNTFEQPEAVKPAAFDGAKLNGDTLNVTMPSKSVVVLEIQ
jgi:alpha-N-arabinofuranosidase